jgi:hypothetical protein
MQKKHYSQVKTEPLDRISVNGSAKSPNILSPRASPKTPTPKSSWLLRLFQSDFFNTWIAVSYLFKYPASVGIQYYLCQRLLERPLTDIQFLLPQLCHLLLHSKVPALEDFIINRCQASTHITILLTWYLEAYLSDFKTSQNSDSFKICKRVHTSCRKILTNGEMAESADIRSTSSIIIGVGGMLAALAMPSFASESQRMALIQGRCDPGFPTIENFPVPESTQRSRSLSIEELYPPISRPNVDIGSPRLNSFNVRRRMSRAHTITGLPIQSPSLEDLNTGDAFSFDNYLRQTRKNLVMKTNSARSLLSLNSLKSFSAEPTTSKAVSSPLRDLLSDVKNQSSSRHSFIESSTSSMNDKLSDQHYFHSEIQFTSSLIYISRRLCKVPKEGRLSTLRAELTLLNHNLPAKVCIPLWCCSTESNPIHHQVLRICPDEAVVLNSADRVPYLIWVEVLESDISTSLNDGFVAQALTSTSPEENHFETEKKLITTNSLPFLPELGAGKDLKNDEFLGRMRTAAIMLAQLDSPSSKISESTKIQIRDKILKEMMQMEQNRMSELNENSHSDLFEDIYDEPNLLTATEDPSAVVFSEDWDKKIKRIRTSSPYGHLANWKLLSVIVKHGADLRQEQLALQIIKEIEVIWQQENIDIWIY